jgi:uncharacterized damage-inducible protein DinB
MLDSYRELLDMVVQGPARLRTAAEAAGDPPAGEWSAAQVLAHMAAAEHLWLERVNRMIRETNAHIRPGRNEKVSQIQAELMRGNVEGNLEAFNAARGEMVSLLMGLSLRDWERTATHETRGEVTIADIVDGIIDHDNEHIEQIERLAVSSQ